MHGNTVGAPDYVDAPTRTEIGEGRFALIRTVSPTRLPPVWGKQRMRLRDFMAHGFFAAFKEDVDALAIVSERIAHFGPDAYELTVRSDELCVLLRRYLKQRSDAEHGNAFAGKGRLAGR
jgi:hypothetical protein